MHLKRLRPSSALLLVAFLGCHEAIRLPTDPTPIAPPPAPAPPVYEGEVWLRGVVYDRESRCLPNALIVITAGRNAGAEAKNDCTRSPYGYYAGYLFTGLRHGDVLGLRAAANGHTPKEGQTTVDAGLDDQCFFDFILDRES